MKLVVGPWQRRKPAVVSLDLRWQTQVHGVAVDRRGRPLQWLTGERLDDGWDTAIDLAQQLDGAGARIRVLLAEPIIQTTWFHGHQKPDIGQIQDALLSDGHPPLMDPMLASLPLGRDLWLLSACDGRLVAPILNGLAGLGASHIELVADSLLLSQRLSPGDASLEAVDDRLLLAARPLHGEPILRSLRGTSEQNFQDLLDAMPPQALDDAVQVLGASRQSLAMNLRAAGHGTTTEPLPWNDTGALAMPHEVAWLLASTPTPPMLQSTDFERIAQQLVWSRRLRRGAVAGGALGILLMVAALVTAWTGREGLQRHRMEQAELHQELQNVQALATEVEAIQTLRTELNQQRAPWPPVALLLAQLAAALPEGAAFERLQITEAGLDLDAWAPTPNDGLFRLLRRHLKSLPQLSNLAWDPPITSPIRGGSVQSLSARIRPIQQTQEGDP